MRILVVSKGSGQGTGASQATRYVARRKNDEGRSAEAEATRLFSAQADSLGDHRANLVLGGGSVPPTKDVLHLVISFAHEEDFVALGSNETERQAAVRELTRATLSSASVNLQATDLRWVAGLHRNTANPHLHLLIHRDYHDRVSGQAKRLQTMPSNWQVRWETTPTGARQTQPGELARTFERLLAERLRQAHSWAHSHASAAREIAPADARSPHSETARTVDELARLMAQRLLAEVRLQTAEQRAAQFAATRHLVRWKIPTSTTERNVADQPLVETTLAATERALGWESDQAKFLGRWQVHWDDARRAAAQVRVAELTAQREEIIRRIALREAEYAEQFERHATLLAALSTLHTQAVAEFKAAGQPVPSARFTAAELQTLDQLAARRGDANFYRTLTQFEREYDAQPASAEPQPLSERLSRALCRSVVAEIVQREAQERLQTFHFKRADTDVWVGTKEGNPSFTARLSDVQPRSRWARAFPSFTTQSVPYQRVVAALAEHEQRLNEELTRATEVRAVLDAVAQTYAAEFQRQSPAQRLPAPRFTPAEQERISTWLARETDPNSQARYAALLRTAERQGQDGQMALELHENEVARTGTPTAPVFVYDSLAGTLPAFAVTSSATREFAGRSDRFDR